MKPRSRRLLYAAGGLVCVALAATLVLTAFQKNLVFFFTPTQVAANEAPVGKAFRIGGLVQPGSLFFSVYKVKLPAAAGATELPFDFEFSGAHSDEFA